MADYEEQASPEEQLEIVNYFIMSAPSGEVNEVVKDCKTLVGKTLTDAKVNEFMTAYNIEQMAFAEAADTKEKLIVSTHGLVSDSTFVNPETGAVLEFNHIDGKFVKATSQKQVLDSSVESYRSAISKTIQEYVTGNYSPNKCVATVYGSANGTITVCISSTNIHLGNFWTGGWRSVYQIDTASKGAKELVAVSKIQVHYFEDGNVQLHADKEQKVTVEVSDPESTAAAVAKVVNEYEGVFQNSLEEMYVDMHETTFRKMRRFLPVRASKMDWIPAAHQLAQEMGNST